MNTSFPDDLDIINCGMRGDSRVFRLAMPYRYVSRNHGTIIVPRGFETDGASVPRIFWTLFSPFGPCFPAAVVHDYLYAAGPARLKRKDCDVIFYDAMKDVGVGWLQRSIIYRAVRIGGASRFRTL